MKNNITRTLSLFLCLILTLSLFPLSIFAVESAIDGPAMGSINVYDWGNKITRYTYSIAYGSVGDWKVEVDNSGGAGGANLQDVLKKSNTNSLADAVNWYKINNNQICVTVDASRIPEGTKVLDLYVSNEDRIFYTRLEVAFITGDVYMKGMNVNVKSPYAAPISGSLDYIPVSAFYYDGTIVQGVDVNSISISSSSGSTGITPLVDADGYIRVLKIDNTANGIYQLVVNGVNKVNGAVYTKTISLTITNDTPQYRAVVLVNGSSNPIVKDIPTQAEGNITIPFSVKVYNGDILDTNYSWRTAISPGSPGISVEGNNIVIKPTAIAGDYELRIMGTKSSTVIGTLKLTLNKVEKDYITINALDFLTIPTQGNSSIILTANVFKNGEYVVNEEVVWGLGSFYNGVSISGNKLTISSIASPSLITVTAKLKSNPLTTSKKEITLRKADTSVKPDSLEMTGIINETWRPAAPNGESVILSLYSIVNGVRNDNAELGLRIKSDSKGLQIVSTGQFNQFELMANGVYEPTTITIEAYSKNFPDVTRTFTINVKPVIEGVVFTNSTISKRAKIEGTAMLVVNSTQKVDAVLVLAVYQDGKLVSAIPQTDISKNQGKDNSLTTFKISQTLPTDVNGLTVKLMLMRGTGINDATELLAEPIILK